MGHEPDVGSFLIPISRDKRGWYGRADYVRTICCHGMFVRYALESRSYWFILAFAGACALGSIYDFLQGAWPFGVVEAIWAGVAGWRWLCRAQSVSPR
jgi:hypothetical protein